MTHLSALQEESTRRFIEELLHKYWGSSKMPVKWLPGILELLSLYSEEPEYALQLVQSQYCELTDKASSYYRSYQNARLAKREQFFDYLTPLVKGPNVADIGGEEIGFLEALISRIPEVKRGYVTDINPPANLLKSDCVKFLLQKHSDRTPLRKNSVDTVILSTVLHHIQPFIRAKLLCHIREVLKDKGRLVVIEDSYPLDPAKYAPKNSLDEQFAQFSNGQKNAILGFLDWWGNRLLKNSRMIPLPCTFQSMDDWTKLMMELEFTPFNQQYLGMPEMNTHVIAPKAIMAFEKSRMRPSKKVLNRKGVAFPDPKVVRLQKNCETMAFVPNSGVFVNVSIGGSKIETSLVNHREEVLFESQEFPWRKLFFEGSVKEIVTVHKQREWIISCVVDQISEAIRRLPGKDSIKEIGIAWPGPFNRDGLMIGPNIEGFRFQDLSEEERSLGGVDLRKMIERRIQHFSGGNNWKISFLNDADAAAIACFRAQGISDGVLLTVGTGIGAGIIKDHKVFESESACEGRIGEIGHHVIYHPKEHRYFYYGAVTKGKILEELTPYSFSKALSGPGIARRFLVRLQREMGSGVHSVSEYFLDINRGVEEKFSDIEIAALQEMGEIGPVVEKKVLQMVTVQARMGNVSAISFVREVGFELGLGVGVFFKEFQEEPFVKRLVISGSVGNHFGRGVVDEWGRDLFLAQVLKGIRWSIEHHDSQKNSLLLSDLYPGAQRLLEEEIEPQSGC